MAKYYVYYNFSFGKSKPGNIWCLILAIMIYKIYLKKTNIFAGKDWGQKEMGAKENEMVGWHHWLNGHEVEQTLGDSEGWGSLACCSSWSHKELEVT